jgi:hypothetical protein
MRVDVARLCVCRYIAEFFICYHLYMLQVSKELRLPSYISSLLLGLAFYATQWDY